MTVLLADSAEKYVTDLTYSNDSYTNTYDHV